MKSASQVEISKVSLGPQESERGEVEAEHEALSKSLAELKPPRVPADVRSHGVSSNLERTPALPLRPDDRGGRYIAHEATDGDVL